MSLLNNYARAPVTFVRGSGAWLEDADGKRYVDFVAGIAVHALGHAHPRVTAAITEQAQKLVHCSNLYYYPPAQQLAQRLCELSGMAGVFFCNSGSEATEAALKLARRHAWRAGHTQRNTIIYASGSFHGRTYGALAATDNFKYRDGFGPLPADFDCIAFNSMDDVARIGDATAAVIVEPVQGESGVHGAAVLWLKALRERCTARGALLIFDEVQCGMGRTGTLFAFQNFNVRPDMVTLAKALGGGLPLGALLVSSALKEVFQPGDHGSTFGGNPVACAAALAVLDVMAEDGVPAHAARVGRVMADGLVRVAAEHPSLIGEVRAIGLMLACDVKPPYAASAVIAQALARGVLIMPGGNSLRFLPPLTITESEIETGLDRLDAALCDVEEQSPAATASASQPAAAP